MRHTSTSTITSTSTGASTVPTRGTWSKWPHSDQRRRTHFGPEHTSPSHSDAICGNRKRQKYDEKINCLIENPPQKGLGLKQFEAQFYKCLLPAPKIIGKKNFQRNCNSYFLVQGMAAPHSHPGMSGIMTVLHQSPRVRWLSRGRRCAASPTASGAAPGRPTCIHPGTSAVLRSIFLHREIVLR